MGRRAKFVIWGWGIAVGLCALALTVVVLEGEDPSPEQFATHAATASDAEPRLPAFPGSLADSPEFLKSIEGPASRTPPRPYLGIATVPESPVIAASGPATPSLNVAIPAGGIEPLPPPILPSVGMPPALLPPILPAPNPPIFPAPSTPPSRVVTAGPFVPPTPVIPAAYPVPGAPTAPVVPAPTVAYASNGPMPILPPTKPYAPAGPVAPAIVVPAAPPGQAVNKAQPVPQPPLRAGTLSNLVYPSFRSGPAR